MGKSLDHYETRDITCQRLDADWALPFIGFLDECHFQFFILTFSTRPESWPRALLMLMSSYLHCQTWRESLSLNSFPKPPKDDSDGLGVGHIINSMAPSIQEHSQSARSEFLSSPFSGAGETGENNKTIQKKNPPPLIIQKKEKGSFVYWMTYSS